MSQNSNALTRAWKKVRLDSGKEYLLAVQHLFAMFGATILVPILTGMNISASLVTAGIGTLFFHLVTKGKVPVLLGSSFVFIAAISAYSGGAASPSQEGIQIAQAGIMAAGILYFIFALIAYFLGADKMKKLFPPVVTGPVIVLIGLGLANTGLSDASGSSASLQLSVGSTILSQGVTTLICYLVAAVTIAVVILFNVIQFKRNKVFKVFNIIPILIGLVTGYLLCLLLHLCGVKGLVDFSGITDSSWFNIPYYTKDVQGIQFFSLPSFKDWGAILSIAIVAIAPFMEHIGDITTNGAVVGKDFFKDPGVHRTLIGDGGATLIAGFLGGPANTTYSENTGVLATTGNYNPKIIRYTAVFAIVLGFFGKFGGILQSIPVPVRGGVELILYGMIAAVGLRTLAASKVDMVKFRNIIIVALILTIGMGITMTGGIVLKFSAKFTMNLSGVFVATIVGIVLNAILPKVKNEVRNMGSEEDIAAAKLAYGEVEEESISSTMQEETVSESATEENPEQTENRQ